MAWEILALTAALLSVFLAALLIMLSRIFDFKLLEQSGKSELVFAISSVFLVLFLIPLVQYGTAAGKLIALQMYEYTYAHAGYLHYTTVDPGTGQELDNVLDSAVFTSDQYTLTEISILYMRAVMYCAEWVGRLAFYISIPAHWISSISQDVFMAYPMSGWAWGGIAQAADNLLNTVYFMELVYRLQIYILRFMDVFALEYILPIGILMRAFPPTRGAGAYVIAFSIGIYLIYPMAYLATVLSSPLPTLCATPEIPAPTLGENSKASLMWEFTMWFRAFEHAILDFATKFSEFANALFINLCLFPFLALTITMTFVQFSSGLFGANVQEIGRGLVKLI